MTIKTKYKIGDKVWAIIDNEIFYLEIDSISVRKFKDRDDKDHNLVTYIFDFYLGKYKFTKSKLFSTLQELLQSLVDNYEEDVEINTKKKILTIKSYHK